MFGALNEPMTYGPSLDRHRAARMPPAIFVPTSTRPHRPYRSHRSPRACPPQDITPEFAAVRTPSPSNFGSWSLQNASDEEATQAAELSVVIPQLRDEVSNILETFRRGPVKEFGDRVTAKGKQERGEIIDPLWKKVVEVACREDHDIAERISDAKGNLNGKLDRVKKAAQANQALNIEQSIPKISFLYDVLDRILRSGDVCVEFADKAKYEWSACEILMVELEELKRLLAENGPYKKWLPVKKNAANTAAKGSNVNSNNNSSPCGNDDADNQAAQGETSGAGGEGNGW